MGNHIPGDACRDARCRQQRDAGGREDYAVAAKIWVGYFPESRMLTDSARNHL